MSPDRQELQRIILRLALMSHAPIQGYNFAPSEVGRAPRWRVSDAKPLVIPPANQHGYADTSIPRGNIDVRGDKTPEYRQKSHVYFWRRLRRVRTDEEVAELLREAREALNDWMRTPEVAGVELERGSFAWKCKIADDDDGTLQQRLDRYSISRATLYRYRAKYRGLRSTFPSEGHC